MTPEDVNAARQRQQAADRAETERKAHAAKLAANRARDQWQRASDGGTSGYLDRKQITPEGVRFDSDCTVLVPMFQYTDTIRLVGLQKITPDGAKRFNKGMEKKGAAYLLGDIGNDDKVAMIAEGYATARSIRMATDEAIPLLICFDAGGILSAARYLRERHPDLHVLICADDDWKIEQRLRDCLVEDFDYSGELVLGGDAVRVETRTPVHAVRRAQTGQWRRRVYRTDDLE